MKWNRRVIVCCSSLVFFGFTGCAKHVRIIIDPSLAPITGIVSPGDTLQWDAATPNESFSVRWQPGLCAQGTPEPIPASPGNPAKCIVAPQTFKPPDTAIEYTYSLEGNGAQTGAPTAREAGAGNPPTTYSVAVGPRHCPACLQKLPTPTPPSPPQPPPK